MGDCLNQLLSSGTYSKLKIVVAFAKQSGIGRLFTNLMNFRNSGGSIEAVVGIDHQITTFQALHQLSTLSGNNLFIHHDRGVTDFHPKVYIFERQNTPDAIVIGSSNLTTGGLYLNYEANVLLSPQGTNEDRTFITDLDGYYNSLLGDTNTQRGTAALLAQLYTQGLILDETRTRSFTTIVNRIRTIPFTGRRRAARVPPLPAPVHPVPIGVPTIFAMTLSAFDVSPRSQDPVILVPIASLKQHPAFWEWPHLFTLSGGGFPERYTNASVRLPNAAPHRIIARLYYYDRKKEFRLQCEPIKRNGRPGDIVVIRKNYTGNIEYEIELIPQISPQFRRRLVLCRTRVSPQKRFGYQ
jgi:hypothetical protein